MYAVYHRVIRPNACFLMRTEFIEQLRKLGFEPEELKDNIIGFKYMIPVGRFQGKEVRIGLMVNDDFPATPPPGPHISPRLLPLNNVSKEHPQGGIHESPLGPDWQYWSRPFANWKETDKTVRSYMAHLRKLFETQ